MHLLITVTVWIICWDAYSEAKTFIKKMVKKRQGHRHQNVPMDLHEGGGSGQAPPPPPSQADPRLIAYIEGRCPIDHRFYSRSRPCPECGRC